MCIKGYNFTITSSNGKSATIKDHEFSSGDADLIEPLGMAGVSGDEGYLYMIYPQGDDVTYTVLPEAESGLEEYDTAFIRDEYEEIGGGATTMSSTPISSTFSMDGTVETSSSSAVEQMVFHGKNNNSISTFENYVVYSSRESVNEYAQKTFNLYLISTKSDYVRQLTADGVNTYPRFSSDGGSIVFIKSIGGSSAVGIIRVNENRSFQFPLRIGKLQSIDW